MTVGVTLDNTLGAVFLGNLFSAILYGVSCVQIYIYYKRCKNDSTLMKTLIAFLWLCDSLHLAFSTHALYFYCVTSFSNPSALLAPTWSLTAHVIITAITDLTIRAIYGRRIMRLSGKNIPLGAALALTTVVVAFSSFLYSAKEHKVKSFAQLDEISWILYTALGSAAFADFVLAVTLCYYLHKKRTGFARTDNLLDKLMLYGLNNGLITTVASLSCLVTYTFMPHTFVYIALYFMVGKVFLNSLLASLNARESLRDQSAGEMSSYPLSHTRGTVRDSKHLAINVETSTHSQVDALSPTESSLTPVYESKRRYWDRLARDEYDADSSDPILSARAM